MTRVSLLGRLLGEPQPRKKRTVKKSMPEDAIPLKLSEILETYSNRDDIRKILDELGLPVSGSKQDLVLRVVKETRGMPIDEVLDLVHRDALRSICEDYGASSSGLKSEMIDKIVAEILDKSEIEGRPPIHRRATRKVEDEPLIGLGLDPLDEILDTLSADSVRSALRKLDLPVSGNKTQVVERLLGETDRDPRRTLEVLPGDALQYFADRKNIRRRRTKEDQVEEILVAMFGLPPSVRGEEPRMTPIGPSADERKTGIRQPVSHVSSTMDTGFDSLVDEIGEWAPIKAHASEEGYTIDLYSYLEGKGHVTRTEEGESRVDILVDNKYPIEIKKGSRLADYDRTFSQMVRHWEAHGSVIAVVCSIRSLDAFEEFRERVDRFLGGRLYRIIRKP